MKPEDIEVGKTYEGDPAHLYGRGCRHYTVVSKEALAWGNRSMWLTRVNFYGEIVYTQLKAFAEWAEKESVMP